jgi:hypothetical protein
LKQAKGLLPTGAWAHTRLITGLRSNRASSKAHSSTFARMGSLQLLQLQPETFLKASRSCESAP